MIRVLSLGAGVQSTCLALLAAKGVIPAPDCAVFADTGWEPQRVYDHLFWLEGQLPFEVHRVSAGNIRDDLVRQFAGYSVSIIGRAPIIPFFAVGHDGDAAPLSRQCTSKYKIEPIELKLRELLGIKPHKHAPKKPAVELWIGISTDEAHRMKPAPQRWIKRRWPLIELGMSRRDCLTWMMRQGYPLPGKSSCIGCPYHGDDEWRDQRDHDPVAWKDANEIDALIRPGAIRNEAGTSTGPLFLHRSLEPLDQVDLSPPGDPRQLDLWGGECEGMCGV